MITTVDDKERKICAVCVPADLSLPLANVIVHQKADRALQCFTDFCKIHFAKLGLSRSQTETMRKKLTEDSKTKDIDDSLMEAVLSQTMCDIVVLQPNRKETNFISINMYVDDKGVAKGLQPNLRASSIAMECGLNIQIMGDCFIGKQFDDDNGFKRFDFSVNDLNTSLPWFKQAKQYNLLKLSQSASMKTKIEEIENSSLEKRANVLKSRANDQFKKGDFVKAIDLYLEGLELVGVKKTEKGYPLAKSSWKYLYVSSIFSNLSICSLKTKKFDEAILFGERCIEYRSDWFKGWGRIAKAYFQKQDFANCIKYTEKALELSSNNVDLLQLLQDAKAKIAHS